METFLRPREYLYCLMFKSYYVVWKQSITKYGRIFDTMCLNRTMQYGNQIARQEIIPFQTFKSYYVVWKRLAHNYILYPEKMV